MDVRCEKCQTEYEFDDQQVPPEGLPVKCSHCGHVFRVQPPVASLPPASGGTAEWKIRQPTGNLFSFRELTTLQRWIVERKVSRDDEISKTGKQWKRLGDIAELATFFQLVDAQKQASAPQQPMPSSPVAAESPVGQFPGAAPVVSAPAQGHFSPSPSPAMPHSPRQGAAWEGQEQRFPSLAPSAAWEAEQNGYSDSFDDDDIEFPRSGRGKWLVFVVLVVIIGGAGAVYLLRPDIVAEARALFAGKVDEATVLKVDTAYDLLNRGTMTTIETATRTFQDALTSAPTYARAHAGLCEANTERATVARQRAEAAEGTASEQLRREAKAYADKAFESGKKALELQPSSTEALVAMAHYYSFGGDTTRSNELLDKAGGRGAQGAAVLYVRGLTEAREEHAERAVELLEKAIADDPDMIRARYALALAQSSLDKDEAALAVLEEILRREPDHTRAQTLRQKLEEQIQKAKTETEAVEEPADEPQADEAQTEEAQAEAQQGPEAVLSVDGLLNQADRLRRSDRAGKALAVYEKAAEVDPSNPEAFAGLGWCYIDLGKPAAAVSSFKRALTNAPRLSDAHMGLAEAYRMRGDDDEAVRHYERYLEIMPNGPEAPVARRMIEMLRK